MSNTYFAFKEIPDVVNALLFEDGEEDVFVAQDDCTSKQDQVRMAFTVYTYQYHEPQ